MVINYMILYVIISLMGFRNQLLGGGTTSKMLWPNNDSCFGLVTSDGWGGWTRKQPYQEIITQSSGPRIDRPPLQVLKVMPCEAFGSETILGKNRAFVIPAYSDFNYLVDFMAFHPPGFWWISWWWPMVVPNLGSCVLRASNGGNGLGEPSRTLLSPFFMQKSWAHEGNAARHYPRVHNSRNSLQKRVVNSILLFHQV